MVPDAPAAHDDTERFGLYRPDRARGLSTSNATFWVPTTHDVTLDRAEGR